LVKISAVKIASMNPGFHFTSHTYSGLGQGPRILITGAVHGNETCGTVGIRRVLAKLDSGELRIQAGSVTFVPVTNPKAYAQGTRNGDRNLNRNLQPKVAPLDFEDHIANWLCPLMAQHQVLLDIHSTHATNPAFAMIGPRNNTDALQPFAHERAEREWALRLGVGRFVDGWLNTYAHGVQTRMARAKAQGREGALDSHPSYGIGTTEYMRSVGGMAITLECGSHTDPTSPDVAERCILNTLAHFGLVDAPAPAPVETYEYLRMVEVIDRYNEQDQFAKPWASFLPLAAGELIGTRADGTPVLAPNAGRILFPDASAKAQHEWFYLTQPGDKLI
jgi:uncharacterized protein